MTSRYVSSTKRNRLYKVTPIADRFWAKVTKPDDLKACWLWHGSTDNKGYGQIRAYGRKGQLLKAHRVSWELAHGPIASGMNVLHRCDTPACVRPEHLFLGTLSDNSQDCASKGRNVFQKHPERHPRGEQVKQAKLTERQVREVRRLRVAGWTQVALAKRFGVTQAAIWFLLKGRTWKDVQS